jgi:pentose-5-phosphate-3-epimerase
MNVIPVINCPDIQGVREKLEVAKTFLFDGDMVHLDVTDGIFSAHKTWNDPLAWITLNSPFALEVHLMMEHPEEHVDDWLVAGAQRLIVHAEAIPVESFHEIVLLAQQYRAEVMISSKPEFAMDGLVPYFKYTKFSGAWGESRRRWPGIPLVRKRKDRIFKGRSSRCYN